MQQNQVLNSDFGAGEILAIMCKPNKSIPKKGIEMLQLAIKAGRGLLWLQETLSKLEESETRPEVKAMLSELYKAMLIK